MISRLFDVQNGKVIPSEHCYTIGWLKDIMDEYEENKEYLKVYMYMFYMTYPNPDTNPYFNMPNEDKEDTILHDIRAGFSPEDPLVREGVIRLAVMYGTPISRAYDGIAGMLDKLALFMSTTNITTGRDGNMSSIVQAAKNYQQIRESFKGAYKDLQEEQESKVRGGKGLSYDQM